MLKDTFFYIWTSTFEEHMAEKLCIVVESNKEDVLNTRLKDFYDIFLLLKENFDEDKLYYYFKKMIVDRGKIDLNNINVNHLNNGFIVNHSDLWNLMSKKYDFLDKSVDFKKAVETTKKFLIKQISKY